MSPMDRENVDQALMDAAPPPVSEDAAREVDRLLQAMACDVMAAQPAGPHVAAVVALKRRRRGLAYTPVVLGVALALSAAAAVTIWHSTASPDFAEVVSRYVAQTPLPPGTDRGAYVDQLSAQGTAVNGSMSEAGVRSMVAYYGSCAWLTSWEVRHDAGDAAGEAVALTSYRAAIGSAWLAAADGGGVVKNLTAVADAAARGDRERVATELRANCGDLPLDGVR